VELHFHYPNTPSWHGTQLKHRERHLFGSSTSALERVEERKFPPTLLSENISLRPERIRHVCENTMFSDKLQGNFGRSRAQAQ